MQVDLLINDYLVGFSDCLIVLYLKKLSFSAIQVFILMFCENLDDYWDDTMNHSYVGENDHEIRFSHHPVPSIA